MISFWVDGLAAPAGSKKYIGHRGGKPVLLDQCKRLPAWRSAVTLAAQRAMVNGSYKIIQNQPVVVGMRFFMTRPRTHYKKDGTLKPDAPIYCLTMPDTTKLVRAVEDSLTAVCFDDDSRVISQFNGKFYEQPKFPPGVLVEVMAIEQIDWQNWTEPEEWSEGL